MLKLSGRHWTAFYDLTIRERLEVGKDMRIGNSLFSLRLAKPSYGQLGEEFGVRYYFTLEDSVEDCPEFLIPMDVLQVLAEQNSLVLESIMPFNDFYTKYQEYSKYETLLHRMEVVGRDGSFLSEDEREIAELYLTFCFRKV